MTTITDDELLQNSRRVQGKVTVITGGSNGIGKETALTFSRFGAKVVIGDMDLPGAEEVVAQITAAGGQAIAKKCNVLVWEDQVALFQAAISTFGSVDIVLPVAGINETGEVCTGSLEVQDGKPKPPNLATLNVNLTGVIHTVHLAMYHFKQSQQYRNRESWKSIVLIGSLSTWQAIPTATMYSSSKHALLGMMRSLYPVLLKDGIRIGMVNPFFAETSILEGPAQLILNGIPLVPVFRIARAILCCAADPDPRTSGCAWVLPDNGPVMRMEKEHLTNGAYRIINQRIKGLL